MLKSIVFLLFICLLTWSAFAQTPPPSDESSKTDRKQPVSLDRNKTPRKESTSQNSLAGLSSSPGVPPAPQAKDNLFVVSDSSSENPDLDTGCTAYRDRPTGSLRINVPVTRVISQIKNQFSEQDVQRMTNYGVATAYATLNLFAFDIDLPYEIDRVLFNGTPIINERTGTNIFYGSNETWTPNKFKIPLHLVKFASFQQPGVAPVPGQNLLEIQIDTATGGSAGWCTSVDWVSLKVQIMSPLILLHGQGDTNQFFNRIQDNSFTAKLDSLGILYDNSITLDSDSIEKHGERLAEGFNLSPSIPNIVKSFGVDSVHLVGHSKGGLDFREYILQHYPYVEEGKQKFKILSLTTLSSPHNGSALADYVVNIKNDLLFGKRNDPALAFLADDRIPGFNVINKGHLSLTPSQMSNFNFNNVIGLNAKDPLIEYYTISANADRNYTHQLDPELIPGTCQERQDQENELEELVNYDEAWGVIPRCTRIKIMQGAYKYLGSRVSLTGSSGAWVSNEQIRPYIEFVFENDGFVTVDSAEGMGDSPQTPRFWRVVRNSKRLEGKNSTQGINRGRNHASVGDGDVVQVFYLWLVDRDKKEDGDLH